MCSLHFTWPAMLTNGCCNMCWSWTSGDNHILSSTACSSKENVSRKLNLLAFIFKSLLRTYCVLSIQIVFCRLPPMHRSGTKKSILTIGVKNTVTSVSVTISICQHLDLLRSGFGAQCVALKQ